MIRPVWRFHNYAGHPSLLPKKLFRSRTLGLAKCCRLQPGLRQPPQPAPPHQPIRPLRLRKFVAQMVPEFLAHTIPILQQPIVRRPGLDQHGQAQPF